MKKKLVLIFDEDSEVAGMDNSYVFCNEKDAESFLLSYESFVDVRILPDEGYFSFKLIAWSGSGRCFWSIDKC
jgi:hypothetical protein